MAKPRPTPTAVGARLRELRERYPPGGLAQLTIGAVLADFVALGWADQITAPAGPGSSTRAGEQEAGDG